ncbi:DMP19 family protein [Marseilla massiliensis]|jgi:hypothetical protein|uniref:DMP19 family protein n=1 Tax=Marseilla massiliensis TaxID=1841864 RepID=A0A938WSF3_9BACT|nr:DMP19 family protein [Marseilla massiliensis]MBM6672450.1 DMP19 family protein [Marseilla massiliensis]CCY65187.1 putative uncharacterized protein [Prevotella sp. CAG:1124]
MNAITINEPELKAAAEKGSDEFLDVFFNAIFTRYGGKIGEPMMSELNADQMTLVAFKAMHDEVMDGGFVQLIYNGYGPFLFFNPFVKVVREWGLDDLASLVNKAGRLFRKYGREIERDCTDEEFMAMFEQYPEFDELDDKFVENEEEWVAKIAYYVDEHIDRFAEVVP